MFICVVCVCVLSVHVCVSACVFLCGECEHVCAYVFVCGECEHVWVCVCMCVTGAKGAYPNVNTVLS